MHLVMYLVKDSAIYTSDGNFVGVKNVNLGIDGKFVERLDGVTDVNLDIDGDDDNGRMVVDNDDNDRFMYWLIYIF